MKRKHKNEDVKVRSATHQDLLLSGKYKQRIERDRTKFIRKQKHRHPLIGDGVFVFWPAHLLL